MSQRIVLDLDSTITINDKNLHYSDLNPNLEIVDKMREYKKLGFEIVIYTSRNMRTYEGNVGKINIHTLPSILDWLKKHDVPFDEIHVGKPWCGFEGFYVDDKAVRPSELVKYTYQEIKNIIDNEIAK